MVDLLTVTCSQLPGTVWSLLQNTGFGILFLKGIDTGYDTAHFSMWVLVCAVGERFIVRHAVRNRRNAKTSKQSSSHRHAGSWGLSGVIRPSLGQPGDQSGTHRSNVLCHHCRARLQEGEWCRSCRGCWSVLNTVRCSRLAFYAGQMLGRRGQKKVVLGSSVQHRLRNKASLLCTRVYWRLLVSPGYPHVPATFLEVQCGLVSRQAWNWGAGFCFYQTCLGAAPVDEIGYNPSEPSFELRVASGWAQFTECREGGKLDSIKNGFCWEPVAIFIGAYPAALEPLQLSEVVLVHTLLEMLILPGDVLPQSQVRLFRGSHQEPGHLPTQEKLLQHGHCHGGWPRSFLPPPFPLQRRCRMQVRAATRTRNAKIKRRPESHFSGVTGQFLCGNY